MKLVVGQMAIALVVLGGTALSYINLSANSYNIGIPLMIWSIIYIPLGIWTRKNPKKAFFVAMIYYLISVVIKDLLFGGEYLLPFLIHIYFTCSMLIGMNAPMPKSKQNQLFD